MSHYMPRIGTVPDVGHIERREQGHHEDEDAPTASRGPDLPVPQSYPGCFGLPYQDHNYGAPRPPTPPPTPPQPPQQMLMPPLAPLTPDKGHIEVEDVGSSAGLPITPPEMVPPKEADDDSITRCICDFVHDDGYMICCDKCSVWQHIDCMGVDRNNIPESYFCELCEPRPLDRESARLIQLKKKEFLDTLTDSSATDTDPEEEANRQLSQQQQQQGGVDLLGAKKLKTKKQRNKSGNNNTNNGNKMSELKQRKNNRKEKRDIKKEKENKDANKKHQRVINKDTSAGLKTKKMKLEKNKKPGLSLVINENAQQDPWDSSFSPWVDKYEEVIENRYSQDILNSFLAKKINGVYTPESKGLGGKLRVQLCHVTEVNKNRKGLEATETIGEGEAVVEYIGEVMYKDQFNKESFYKRLNPFVLFYSKYDDMDICIDATSYGNIARFIRRSCKANAEVHHVVQNGCVNFYVYSTKVIPRGSEITIPYDYNYKDCTYCVECACLRNNCPVAKFFKKRMNSNIKKDKSPQSLPKLPVKSPIKVHIKSPVRKSPEELSPPESVADVKSPTTEIPEQVVSKVEPVEQVDNNSMSGDLMEASLRSDDEETGQSNPNAPMSESATSHHKMTREERKMEAIMKAFEKLEKREERRNQALSRMERKSTDTRKEEKPAEKMEKPPVKKEEKKEKPPQKETRSKKKEEEAVIEAPQEPPPPMETESTPEESIIPEVAPVEQQPAVVKETRPRPKTRRAKRVSSRRRNRAGSGNAVSEPSLSVDAADESSIVPQPAPPTMPNSCPNTPLVTTDTANVPPSFRFLKTKKHLMNEWLHEKSQDVVTATSSPAKTEPLEVNVEDDTMFVTCLPSPRNAMEHLRRNSHSSGSFRPVINAESSIGSAKKRWLRQAMIEKPKSDSGSNSPNTTGGANMIGGGNTTGGGNASPGMPSPGASPPGDFVTPLKKRRMARESVDGPQSAGPSTSSPLLGPTVSQFGELEGQPTEVAQEESKPFFPNYTPSVKMEIPKKRAFVSPRDLRKASIRDSMESEVSDSSVTVSSRLSVDQSSDSEHEQTLCPQKVTGSNSIIHSELVSMEDRTSGIDQSLLSDTSHTCEVTNSSAEEDHSMSCGGQEEGEKLDSTSDSVQRPVGLNIVEEDENVSSGQQARPSVVEEEEEEVEVEDESVSVDMDVDAVDSTEDQRKNSTTRRSVCDSTSRSDSCSIGSSSRVDSANINVMEDSCSTSNMEDVCRPSSMASQSQDSVSVVEPQCVDSSTDMLSSQTQEVSMEVDELPEESHSPQEVSTLEERPVGVDSSVDSSSDQQGGSSGSRNSCGGGVSSSSELQLEDSIVESTHLSEGTSVSSSAVVTSDHSVTENDMVDSSVSDRFEITVEAELVNLSDIGQNVVDNTVSSNQGSSFSGVRQSEELCSTSSSHEEMGSEVHVEDDGSRSDSITVTTPSELSASPADSEPAQGTSTMEPESEPVPAKKKVSLLEYRKRLKEKGPTSTSSSTSSLSSLSSSSSSSVPRPSSTSSQSPSFNVHTRLPSLPSLPLFDTSPSKDSSAQNHRQFKSSSDLIRRKSTEAPKREKPLSLTERLKKEFGFEDSEDESGKEEAVPDPPPPPHQPPQQSSGNFKTPMVGGYSVQPPQAPHSMHGDNPHRLPSPGLVPVPPMVPPLPQGQHGGNLLMPPPPGQLPPLMNHGGPPPQPVPPPGPVPPPSNGSIGSQMGQAPPVVGKKIPSLMSIPSYHTKGRGGSNHTQGGSNAANLAQPVNGHHDQNQQPYGSKPGLPPHIQQPFTSVAPPANFTHPPPQPVQAPYSSAPPNQQYPPPPQALPQPPYPSQQQQQGQHFIATSSHPSHYQTPPPPPQPQTPAGQYVPTPGPSPGGYHSTQHQGAGAPYSQGSVGSYNSYQTSPYQQPPPPPAPNGHQLRDYNHSYKNSHDSEQQSHYNHSPKNYHGSSSSSHRQKSKKSKHRKSGSSRSSYSDYH